MKATFKFRYFALKDFPFNGTDLKAFEEADIPKNFDWKTLQRLVIAGYFEKIPFITEAKPQSKKRSR